VYAWIWRRLPFGLPGKIIGSLVLTLSVVALLWYVVFPWAEPILPFDDVQVGGTDGVVPGGQVPADGGASGAPAGTPDPTDHPGEDHDIPYETGSNNPEPTPDR
jgi:hypothetical protein